MSRGWNNQYLFHYRQSRRPINGRSVLWRIAGPAVGNKRQITNPGVSSTGWGYDCVEETRQSGLQDVLWGR
jgi:hypothetical protein